MEIYRLLLARFGPLDWWPGDTAFEVMVGAILTQNTAWTNVEKAIDALKEADILTPEGIRSTDIRRLKKLIKPSGYYNQKAQRLKIFARFLLAKPYSGKVKRLAAEDTMPLREKLLAIKGIGPETADSMLLYALEKPVFVVDAYTRRAFTRLGYLPPKSDYHETQALFIDHLPPDIKLYNDFHARIVYLGKDYCKTRPVCAECPLKNLKRCTMEER